MASIFRARAHKRISPTMRPMGLWPPSFLGRKTRSSSATGSTPCFSMASKMAPSSSSAGSDKNPSALGCQLSPPSPVFSGNVRLAGLSVLAFNFGRSSSHSWSLIAGRGGIFSQISSHSSKVCSANSCVSTGACFWSALPVGPFTQACAAPAPFRAASFAQLVHLPALCFQNLASSCAALASMSATQKSWRALCLPQVCRGVSAQSF